MGFVCIACDSGDCVQHGSIFAVQTRRRKAIQAAARIRLASMETLTVAGMPLVRTHTCKECDTWELLDKPANEGGEPLGEISLYHLPEFPYPSINSINFEKARGRGLGRQSVVALASFYGGLTSDPQRNTSDAAKNMWRAIPGAKEVLSPKQYQHGDKPPERRLPWETDEFLNQGKMFILQGGFKSLLLMRQSKGLAEK